MAVTDKNAISMVYRSSQVEIVQDVQQIPVERLTWSCQMRTGFRFKFDIIRIFWLHHRIIADGYMCNIL